MNRRREKEGVTKRRGVLMKRFGVVVKRFGVCMKRFGLVMKRGWLPGGVDGGGGKRSWR